jgi:hypothetical protein
MIQANTHVEKGQEAKYEAGSYLVFIGWARDEIHGEDRRAGDFLRVEARNGCGMGIDAARVGDQGRNRVDMVWPEEVLELGDQDPVAARRIARGLRRARARHRR